VVAAVEDRLSISQRGTQKFNMKRYDLENLKEVELRKFMRLSPNPKQFEVTESLDDNSDFNLDS